MHEPTTALLEEVLGSVLQDSAFIFAEPLEEEPRWASPVVSAEISFESVRSGLLRLTTVPSGAIEVSANMLGVDTDDAEARANGSSAVAEILNVVAGAFVTRFFGTTVPSQLGLPTSEVHESLPSWPRTCAAALMLESGDPILLELDLRPAGAG